MEHGSDNSLTNNEVSDLMKNGEINPIMANFPDGPVIQASNNKTTNESNKPNGEGPQDYDIQENPFDDSYSSESDALVIDESVPKRKARGKYYKKSKENVQFNNEKDNEGELNNSNDFSEKLSCIKPFNLEVTDVSKANQCSVIQNDLLSVTNENSQTCDDNSVTNEPLSETIPEKQISCDIPKLDSDISNNSEIISHSNPFFHESLFELSQLHHSNSYSVCSDSQNVDIPSVNKTFKRAKAKPRFKEYAQYLGLQPAIQFKCPRCGKSGFESLSTLQEHFQQCNSIQPLEKTSGNDNVSGFKLTRKVFLCSSCGTYYENWNLYMHMLEYHKRYICLYCLGMFSVLDDLCQHIQTRHNLEPGIKNTLEDFYNTYNEPCYVVCCECNQQFNEGDNFFYHNCVSAKTLTKNKSKHIKSVIAPEDHVTGDSLTKEATSTNPNNIDSINKACITESHNNIKIDKLNECVDNSSFKLNSNNSAMNTPAAEQVNNNKCENIPENEGNFENRNNNENVIDHFESDSGESGSISQDILENSMDNCKQIDDARSPSLPDNSDKDMNDEYDYDCDQDSRGSSRNSDKNHQNQQTTEGVMEEVDEQNSESGENIQLSDDLDSSVETRKVPKLSLKLPKPGSYPDPEESDESDKVEMEVDNIESENEQALSDLGEDADQIEKQTVVEQNEESQPEFTVEEAEKLSSTPQYSVAGLDIPVVEIELDQPLDKMDIKVLLQKCLRATVLTCIYCNHSRRIAVNGKQLGLHAIAEHRFSAINKSITEEELIPESFNMRIKECLEQLETVFFNLDSAVSDEAVTFSHVFECFQCHYSTTVHKELYLHNRKFHSKNLLLCIMCKSNFYSYSELICHLCPGVYVLDYDLNFRCCMCVSDDLPSSFRLMVHLRKRHNVCDVCLEMCHSQYKLSNHVWKHKLHHFCYRCGIAYRNKPDITRHLFWKHGTESVLCKRCLQKKWPHVYHFCVPPASFVCEECNLMFTRAVSLKVHKRLHSDEKKHACTWEECTESFISKKLMLKHLKWHTDPPEEVKVEEETQNNEEPPKEGDTVDAAEENKEIKEEEDAPKAVKPKVDVYDLPELNLSESDSSDSETEPGEIKSEETANSQEPPEAIDDKSKEDTVLTSIDEGIISEKNISEEDVQISEEPEHTPVDDTSSSVIQDIWDNFKNYQANKEKMDNMLIGEVETKIDQPYVPDIPIPEVEEGVTWQLALRDHDYCMDPEKEKAPDTIIEVKPSLESTESIDHDYCFDTDAKEKKELIKPVTAVPPPPDPPTQEDSKTSPRKRTSSSSSSSSDSDSSCACGSSCSCSDSTSGSSSSSSDSSNSDSSTEEGRKRQLQRRLKRKERNKASKNAQAIKTEAESKVDVVTTDQPPVVVEMPIHESDLDTTESETDEEFYDREPQKFARKILEERRAQMLSEMGPNMVPNGSFIESTSRPPTPPAGTVDEEQDQPKRKKKTKKRKKRRSEKKAQRSYSSTVFMDPEPVAPPPSVPYYQQFHQMGNQSPSVAPITLSLARNSPVRTSNTPPLFTTSTETPVLSRQESTASDTSVRASKRRRVPNKFYGYSSDEEADKPQSLKRSKVEINRTIPAPSSPMLVPPITIKTISSPTILPPRPPVVEPITLRLPKPYPSTDYKTNRRPPIPPIRLSAPRPPLPLSREDSGTESNESDLEDASLQPPLQIVEPPKPPQPQLYCYCRCPYDEVSEMIGCDSNDCQIEWFHFECVGIMVPPKGQWFCPDCRKKKQQQRGLV